MISGPFTDTYANSRIPVIPREEWTGWEFVDFIVQEGGQFYVSETQLKPQQQTLFTINPTQVKWAKYDLKEPWGFEWDRTTAIFEPRSFKDVQAVGWTISKPSHGGNTTFWLKWYAFGMDAVVNRPESIGWNLEMSPVVGSKDLFSAKSPVTYGQWSKIYRWAARNQFALHPGYNFNQDGNPGTALADDKNHSTDEPVTGITWQDAALWCNALSEYEGKTPCYYEDPAFAKVLRSVKNRASENVIDELPAIYHNPAATGYRLPLPSEVSSLKPAFDGRDLWFYAWDIDGSFCDPAGRKTITVFGGKKSDAALPYGEIPSRGHHNIGFVPVCSTSGASTPAWKAAGADYLYSVI